MIMTPELKRDITMSANDLDCYRKIAGMRLAGLKQSYQDAINEQDYSGAIDVKAEMRNLSTTMALINGFIAGWEALNGNRPLCDLKEDADNVRDI